MTDPTGSVPVAGEPDPPGRDRRKLAIAAVAVVDVILIVVLLAARAGDGDDVATDAATTTTTSSSTTTASTTTTSSTTTTTPTTTPATSPPPPTGPGPTTTPTAAPSTTAAPPSTIATSRCTGRTAPDDPDPVAELFYEAWTVDDRRCAERIATPEAVEALFRFDGSDADWSFQGCAEDEEADEPHSDCPFRYEGGTAIFELRFSALRGWQVTAVEFIVD